MGNCACIRSSYDFDLVQTKCSSITYIDRSVWQSGAEYSDTPSYVLNLTLPDGSTKTYDVTVGTPTHIDLGNCVAAGIYEFSVVSCTEKYSKKIAIICSLYCGWLRAINKLGQGVEIETIRSIRERLEYIEVISSSDILTAAALINSVERDIDKISCQCVC